MEDGKRTTDNGQRTTDNGTTSCHTRRIVRSSCDSVRYRYAVANSGADAGAGGGVGAGAGLFPKQRTVCKVHNCIRAVIRDGSASLDSPSSVETWLGE